MVLGSGSQNVIRPSKNIVTETLVKEESHLLFHRTSNSLPHQCDVNPETLQFTEEEVKSVAEFFKDPATFEFLQKAGNSKVLQESSLGRLSLYVKFDPLLRVQKQRQSSHPEPLKEGLDEKFLQTTTNDTNTNPDSVMTQHDGKQELSYDLNKLIDLSSSPKLKLEQRRSASLSPKNQKTFSEEEVNQALKMQELLYQEKLIKKDKQWNEQLKTMEKKKQILEKQVASLKDLLAVNRAVTSGLVTMVNNFLHQKENERIELGASNQDLTEERDQALEDLRSVESAFADLHRRYEKTKGIVEGYKQNEEWMKQHFSEMQMKLKNQEQMYEELRNRTEKKLDSANLVIENTKRVTEAEKTALTLQLKKAEMRISSLENNLEYKTCENTKLSNICDELIAKVGKI
ncbi:transforming acidic coiled-coil-containing protein 3-like isoform X3 [Tachypleus tridentatus]|uniref:transforming acidic coiled-coil-containing protein 3-like isoform X3 n=1 Tax=Tachypleus tridentatus TaxID=6853 RepID=UPI003FD5E29C